MVARPPGPSSPRDPLPNEERRRLVDASLTLDLVEPVRAGVRADDPSHRTAARARARDVVVTPGWGARPTST